MNDWSSDMQKTFGARGEGMDGYECCTGSAVESKSIVHAVYTRIIFANPVMFCEQCLD